MPEEGRSNKNTPPPLLPPPISTQYFLRDNRPSRVFSTPQKKHLSQTERRETKGKSGDVNAPVWLIKIREKSPFSDVSQMQNHNLLWRERNPS